MTIRLLVLLLLLAVPAAADAASWWRSIAVEWEYTPPIEPAVEAFVLYTGGKEVCRFDGADARTGTCEVIVSALITPLTLTAAFVDGTESPHSRQFELSDTVPEPVIKSITR